MSESRITVLFSLLLFAHALHIAEEAWGGFWLIGAVFGLPLFLLLNTLGLIVAVAMFFGVRSRTRWVHVLAVVYVAFMALQGIGHNVAWAFTGRYFGGFAGGITGLALLVIGVPLGLLLYRNVPPARRRAA